MKQNHPLPLHHTWPLYERERYFELGQLFACETPDSIADVAHILHEAPLARPALGVWECDLADNDRLSWSDEVYDIFGIRRGAAVARAEAAALYSERSRAAMERLRAYAIRHRRGFTLDVEICPAQDKPRWMRLIAAPFWGRDRVVKLQGLKFIVPARD